MLSPVGFVLASGALTFGVPLVIALRELAVMRPPRPWGGPPAAPDPVPVPPRDNPDTDRKPLPDCLIPKLPPRAPVRDLELVD